MRLQLTKETLTAIRGNMLLLDKISKELNVKPETVIRLSFKNYRRLTELSILQIISKHTGKPIEKLVQRTKVEAIP
jgi:hypothetical protein